MHSKFLVTHLHPAAAPPDSLFYYASSYPCKIGCCGRDSSEQRFRFKLVGQSPVNKWKLKNLNSDAMQEKLNLWLSRTQDFLSDVTSPLVKTAQGRKPDSENASSNHNMDELFMTEQTIDRKTPNGMLSLAAIVSIEQFSRMNGLTGQKMQKIFKDLVPETVHSDARNLVEYCCFRFLSRDNSTLHPSLKEPAFQRLIFITMLAWDNPYSEELAIAFERASFESKLVREEAFVRIAPAIPGLADRSTAHNLFKALAGEEQGISLHLWVTYVHELHKVHEKRKSYQIREHLQQSEEKILCTVSSRKPPVLKWENNMAWPGWIVLTEKALYFEAVGIKGQKDARRLDLTKHETKVEKAKVGPLGSELFDSAISISSGPGSESWVLEFVDLGGELRRDVWHAVVSEVISLHKFISDFGPADGDQSVFYVYGANKGKEKAINSAINSISRLQALQVMRKLPDDPTKLVQFSYLQNAPYGEVVAQALALNYWGGPLVTNATMAGSRSEMKPPEELLEGSSSNVIDLDGSIYLQKWMRSSSWSSSASITFWKNSSIRNGLVLSKNLVVADASLVEKAAGTCREKFQLVEKTQATIDAAMIKGIPSNIDLFKELMLPLTIIAQNFDKLRRWQEPHLTLSFLAFAYTIIFRNLLSYVLPATLLLMSVTMLTLKGLKDQGRLGRSFGKVTIRDQPPSNTIQKIIALKDAMRDVENYLQNLNVTLLKIRTVVLSGQPQITTEVALVLLSSATILLIVPFKYVLAFFLFDLFTRELEFRKDMVKRFMSLLKERWEMVPAAPVVVLPYEDKESRSRNKRDGEGWERSDRSQNGSNLR